MSKAKRGATDLSGIIAVDKPSGMTSHDVVDAIRRLTNEGRIGHAGTLDPMATGLLLVCIGPTTRLSELIMSGDKTYEARITFGAATDTDDSQGSIIARAPLPNGLDTVEFAQQVLKGFLGEQLQMPPLFSAIKKDGKKAYESARQGKSVDLEPRLITVHSLELIETSVDFWDIEAVVSKGTYIRALARDIGEAVGSKAHLTSLRRVRCGSISIEQAYTLKELETRNIRNLFLDPQADFGIPEESIPKGLRNVI